MSVMRKDSDMDNSANSNDKALFEETRFKACDAAASLASLVLGFLFVKWIFLPAAFGLGAFVFTLLVTALAVCCIKAKKIKTTLKSNILLGLTLIFSTVFIISSNHFIKSLVFVYVLFSFIYWFFTASGNRQQNSISDMFVFDMLKSVFVMPFSKFGAAVSSIFSVLGKHKSAKKLGLVLLGIITAAVPTFIITVILMSADSAFKSVMDKIFNVLIPTDDNIIQTVLELFLGFPAGCYIFGMLYAGSERLNSDIMTKEQNLSFLAKLRFAPAAFMYASVTPLCIVYVIFFFSQTSYYLSAFSGILPGGYSYAEYARDGFFQLASVAVINIVIVALFSLITKYGESKDVQKPLLNKIYITLLSSFTIILIITAVSKMLLYISHYGLTPKRIYVTWFMVLMTVVFVLIIIRQFTDRLNFWGSSFVAFILLFALLSFSASDRFIADYNMKVWNNQPNEENLGFIAGLSHDAAADILIPLSQDDNYYLHDMARNFCKSIHYSAERTYSSFTHFNISSAKAAAEFNKLNKDHNTAG